MELLLLTSTIWLGFTMFVYIFVFCAILLNKTVPVKCMNVFYKIIILLGLLTVLAIFMLAL